MSVSRFKLFCRACGKSVAAVRCGSFFRERFSHPLLIPYKNATVKMQQDVTLEQRVADLEAGKQYEATKSAVEKVEEEFLVQLRDIRAAIVSGGQTSTVDNKELEALRAENKALKERNDKLEYRVKHMVASMEELYAKSKGK